MIRSFTEEAKEAIADTEKVEGEREVGIITGFAAKALMEETAEAVMKKFPNVCVRVYAIKNNFFGGGVTVSGLVCGCDIIDQLKNERLPKEILMPEVMFRSGTDILLDDVTIEELSEKLNVNITKVKTDGFSTVGKILGTD